MGTAGAKVTVASKLPMAIEMQCCRKVTQNTITMGMPRQEDVYYKEGDIVTVNGTAYPIGQVPPGMPDKPQMVKGTGFALTFNVDKDFFERWLEENKNSAMVKNHLIFAYEKIDDVKGDAKEFKALDSGLGPLVPDNDRRMPRKIVGRQTRALAEESAE